MGMQIPRKKNFSIQQNRRQPRIAHPFPWELTKNWLILLSRTSPQTMLRRTLSTRWRNSRWQHIHWRTCFQVQDASYQIETLKEWCCSGIKPFLFPSNKTSCLFQNLPLTSMNGMNGQSNNYVLRIKSAIVKTQNWGENSTSNSNKETEKGPQRFYFNQSQKDPNSMDVTTSKNQY